MLGCPCFGRGGEGMEGHVWGVDGGGLGSRWGAIMGGSAIRMLILGIAQPPIIGFVQNNIRPRFGKTIFTNLSHYQIMKSLTFER